MYFIEHVALDSDATLQKFYKENKESMLGYSLTGKFEDELRHIEEKVDAAIERLKKEYKIEVVGK